MDDIEKNDNNIINELKNDSERAYTQLYNRYSSLLYSFVFKLTKSDSLTQDIVQEAFIKIWVNRKELSIDTSIKSYLFKMVQNMAIDTFRQQVNKPEITGYLELIQDTQVAAMDDNNFFDLDAFEARLKKAKQTLTQQQRLIFVLVKEDEKKIAEVAELLNISEQSVRNQLSVALAKMRKHMKEFFPMFVTMFYNI